MLNVLRSLKTRKIGGKIDFGRMLEFGIQAGLRSQWVNPVGVRLPLRPPECLSKGAA